jgi:glycolate oxidase iron-sulfur subunit
VATETAAPNEPPKHLMPAPHSGRSLIDDCVHCGFCLPHCPTYLSWGEEMDSPRGRIVLMKGLAEGTLKYDDNVVEHFDRCLGCMACVTACPSGVKYDVLIEDTRAKIEEHHRRSLGDKLHRRMIFTLFPYPRRLKALLGALFVYNRSGLQWLVRKSGVLRALPRRLAQLDALMPAVTPHHLAASLPHLTPAKGTRRLRVALLAGCVQRRRMRSRSAGGTGLLRRSLDACGAGRGGGPFRTRAHRVIREGERRRDPGQRRRLRLAHEGPRPDPGR